MCTRLSLIRRFGLDLTRLIRRCARAFSSLCNGDCGREAARLGIQLRDKHGTAAGPTACAIAIPTQPSSGQERRGEKHSVVALRHQTFLWRAFFTSAKVTREPLENWSRGARARSGGPYSGNFGVHRRNDTMSAVCVRVVLFCSSGPESAAAPGIGNNGNILCSQRQMGRVPVRNAESGESKQSQVTEDCRTRKGCVCNAESGESSQGRNAESGKVAFATPNRASQVKSTQRASPNTSNTCIGSRSGIIRINTYCNTYWKTY